MYSSTVATWAFSLGVLKSIAVDPWVSKFADIVVDRSIDLVLASFLRKRALMAECDMDVDNDEPETPADMSGAQSVVIASKATKSADADEDTENGNDANDGGQDARAASLEAIEEALIASIDSCKQTYVTAVGGLLSAACARYEEVGATASEDERDIIHLDPQLLGVVSMLKRILRTFHGFEEELLRACVNFNEDNSTFQIAYLEEAKGCIAGIDDVPAFISDVMSIYSK